MSARFLQLARRLGLLPAANEIGLVGLVLAHDGKLLAVLERRIVGDRHLAEPPALLLAHVGEPFRRALELGLIDRRAVRLDRDDGLDQVRPRVGDRPDEGARLRMDHQHCGPDLVEQRDAGVAVDLLLLLEADQRRKLRGVERIERRVARLAGAGPLRVQLGLRPQIEALGRDEALLGPPEVAVGDLALRLREMRRAAARHLIDHIDRVAAPHEILRPAFAAVRRAGEVGAGLAAAVDHHDRVGVRQRLRNEVFDVHVPGHRRARHRRVDLAAGEQIAGLGEHHRRLFGRMPRPPGALASNAPRIERSAVRRPGFFSVMPCMVASRCEATC